METGPFITDIDFDLGLESFSLLQIIPKDWKLVNDVLLELKETVGNAQDYDAWECLDSILTVIGLFRTFKIQVAIAYWDGSTVIEVMPQRIKRVSIRVEEDQGEEGPVLRISSNLDHITKTRILDRAEVLGLTIIDRDTDTLIPYSDKDMWEYIDSLTNSILGMGLGADIEYPYDCTIALYTRRARRLDYPRYSRPLYYAIVDLDRLLQDPQCYIIGAALRVIRKHAPGAIYEGMKGVRLAAYEESEYHRISIREWKELGY